MKHVAAYMLCVLGGNKSPSADDVKNILKAVDAKADDTCLQKVIHEMNGKDLDSIIAEGMGKFAKVGGGGGGGGGGDKKAAKKAPEPEEDEDMGFSLFD